MKFCHSRHDRNKYLKQQEILAISKEISDTFSPHSYDFHVELVLMPVDPLHLYAYWKTGDIDEKMAIEMRNKQLVLRLYTLQMSDGNEVQQALSHFDIPVHGLQSQKKVRLPFSGMTYIGVLGVLNMDNSLQVILTSNIINIPRLEPVVANQHPIVINNDKTPEIGGPKTQVEIAAEQPDIEEKTDQSGALLVAKKQIAHFTKQNVGKVGIQADAKLIAQLQAMTHESNGGIEDCSGSGHLIYLDKVNYSEFSVPQLKAITKKQQRPGSHSYKNTAGNIR